MTLAAPANSGEGSRPVTNGAADNIGTASGFDREKLDDNVPASLERSPLGKADATSIKKDDSAPGGLTGDARSGSNREKPGVARDNI